MGEKNSMRGGSKLKMNVVLCFVSFFGFFSVLFMVNTGVLLATWDVPWWDWFVAHRNNSYTNLFKVVTTLSSSLGLMILTALFVAFRVLVKKDFYRPLILVFCMVFSVGVSTVLKFLVGRSRPASAEMLLGVDDSYSFPSGHTLGAAVFLSVVGYLLFADSRRLVRFFVVLGGFLLVVLVAVSRMYLGYHWLTDVVASMFLSLSILALAIFLVDRLVPTRVRAGKRVRRLQLES